MAELVEHDHRHERQHHEQYRPGVEHDGEHNARQDDHAQAHERTETIVVRLKPGRRDHAGSLTHHTSLSLRGVIELSCAAMTLVEDTRGPHAGKGIGRENILYPR